MTFSEMASVFRCVCVKFAVRLHSLIEVAMCGCFSSAVIFIFLYLLLKKALAAFQCHSQRE